MGIEHRMKDEEDDNFWKCPHCGAVEELFENELSKDQKVECSECGDKSVPHDYPATWDDFWIYCQSLKDI